MNFNRLPERVTIITGRRMFQNKFILETRCPVWIYLIVSVLLFLSILVLVFATNTYWYFYCKSMKNFFNLKMIIK